MPHFLDSVPFSGIIRIRDMMYAVERPFRLDQGDVSFDAPDTVKQGMVRAIADNQSHYLQTSGVPRLQELLAEKLRAKNGVPVASPDEVLVTNGGIHALYILFQALLEPGDEVLIPDPLWPPGAGTILSARGVVVRYPLHEAAGWRFDIDELEASGRHCRLEYGEEFVGHLRCLLSGRRRRSLYVWYNWSYRTGDPSVPTHPVHPAEVFPSKTKAWAGRPRFISVTSPQPTGRMKSIAVPGVARYP